jgi:O-antigen ligase
MATTHPTETRRRRSASVSTETPSSSAEWRRFFKSRENWIWTTILVVNYGTFADQLFGGATSHISSWLHEAVGVGALLLLLRPTRGRERYLQKLWPFGAFLFYCVLDSILNPDPSWSIKTLGVFLTAAAPPLVMALRLRPIDYARVVMVSLSIGCLLSLAAIIFVPSIGRSAASVSAGVDDIGGWKGAYSHKNGLGHLAGLTFSVALIFARRLFSDTRFWLAAMLVSIICALGSKSSTGIILTVAVPAFYLAAVKPTGLARYASIFFTTLFFFAMLIFRDEIVHSTLALLGKNSSLSGRTDIWLRAGDLIKEHPLFGQGYGYTASDGYHAMLLERFQIQYTHNNYLDVLLNIGLFGLVGFLALIGMAVAQAWRRPVSPETSVARNFFTVMMLGAFVSGWTESWGMTTTQIFVVPLFGLFGAAIGEARTAPSSRRSRSSPRRAELTREIEQHS